MTAGDKLLYLVLLPLALLASAGYAASAAGHSPALGQALIVLLATLGFTVHRLGARVWRREVSGILLLARLAASVLVAAGAGMLSWLGADSAGLPGATAATYAALLAAFVILSSAR